MTWLADNIGTILTAAVVAALLGQCLTHSMQRIHSVPFILFLELSVTSTSMGHTRLHLPQDTHFVVSHLILKREK